MLFAGAARSIERHRQDVWSQTAYDGTRLFYIASKMLLWDSSYPDAKAPSCSLLHSKLWPHELLEGTWLLLVAQSLLLRRLCGHRRCQQCTAC